MSEEITQIAEMLNSLGDKGLTAFVVWIALDFGKLLVGWTGGIILAAMIFSRLRDSVILGIREAKEER